MLRPMLAGLFVLVPQLVHACSCLMLTSPCDQGWKTGGTIFLGRVVAMEKVGEPSVSLSSHAAHFIVEESFRGADATGKEIVIYTGGGGGDCGYPFVAGTSYLVYASGVASDGGLHTSICSETKPAVRVGGVLPELRAIRDRKRPDDLFGTIGAAPEGSGWEALTETQPLAGVPVRATGSSGRSFSSGTDSRGAYAFPSLPAGTYRIEADLPQGFERPQPRTAEVILDGAACRIDSFASPDGRIEGTVVDSNANPVVGLVTLEPADPVEAAAARKRGGMPGDDAGADGKFSLRRVAPGRYRLRFYPKIGRGFNFRATIYWPSNPDDAIGLAFGQHVGAIQFTVPLSQLP
jgi:hypothetical protein